MISNNGTHNLGDVLNQIAQKRPASQQTNEDAKQVPPVAEKYTAKATQDIVTLSTNNNKLSAKQSNLVSETTQETENGFRRTQEFENANGKTFTRIEEITTSEDRSKRVVIQQNESGSTTALENIVDRQEDGTFRLIQRFTDETGEIKTNVQLNFNPNDADILLGRSSTSFTPTDQPFQSPRGTQVDLTV